MGLCELICCEAYTCLYICTTMDHLLPRARPSRVNSPVRDNAVCYRSLTRNTEVAIRSSKIPVDGGEQLEPNSAALRDEQQMAPEYVKTTDTVLMFLHLVQQDLKNTQTRTRAIIQPFASCRLIITLHSICHIVSFPW